MENILILLAITSAVIIAVVTKINTTNARQGRRIDKLDDIVDWRIMALDDRLYKVENCVRLATKDNDQLKEQITTLESRMTALEANIKQLEGQITQLAKLLETRPEPEDNKMAEQWENVINFNPLKDLEVTRGN